ncbi:DUF502 domain-containing protein [Anaerosinus gibii]|uniref:DUF502 domain-containing protein n=1 Tax=Selenobaculum gibii TaxID=3054208 RepID=A0A9Y2AFB7_9FIRM|nr:DUF502 domain-containing protein [Selenobaculum gbiensis]WIW69789.1 DUF502 domain-containing protein [Selenobaculum gbiensis]
MKFLSRYFINGLLVIVPIAITILVIVEVFQFTEGVLGKYIPIDVPGIGFVTVIGLILCIGWLSSCWIMKQFIHFGEFIVGKIPFVKFIYNSVKHLSSAVFESKNLFKQAVLVPYPHQGVKAVGFIMADLSEAITEKLDDEYVCVFIPWSLNVTSGSNILIPKKDVIYLDVSVESALQYTLTAGSVMPTKEMENISDAGNYNQYIKDAIKNAKYFS